MDAVHGRAGADDRIEAEDELVGMLLGQALDQVDLRANGPLAASGGLLNLLNDVFGRAVEIGGGHDLLATLGMNQDLDAGIFRAGLLDLLEIEAHMRRAVALPENDLRPLDLLVGAIGGHWIFGIPDKHLMRGNPI